LLAIRLGHNDFSCVMTVDETSAECLGQDSYIRFYHSLFHIHQFVVWELTALFVLDFCDLSVVFVPVC